jgi:AP2 domain/HNH endonuclease
MKTIPLTQGLCALVDDEDYEELSKYKWYAVKAPKTYYAYRNIRINKLKQKQIGMHQHLLGFKAGFEIDHINHNGIDNRRENLRWATDAQNSANKPRQMNNSSGVKGVYFDTRKSRWRARLMVKGRRIHIGTFSSLIDAEKAYREAAEDILGEFACT